MSDEIVETEKPKEFRTINSRPREDLVKIAQDLSEGKIYTDLHAQDSGVSLQMIFMPLAFGGLGDWSKEELEQIGVIFEHMDKAGPMAVNGQPGFMSFQILNVEDTKFVFDAAKKIEDSKKAVAQSLMEGTTPNGQ